MPIEQWSCQADDNWYACNGDRDRRRLRVADPADHCDIEQDQPGRRDGGQPQPVGPAGANDLYPGDMGRERQQCRCRGVADLCGEQRSIAKHVGDGNAPTDEPCGGRLASTRTLLRCPGAAAQLPPSRPVPPAASRGCQRFLLPCARSRATQRSRRTGCSSQGIIGVLSCWVAEPTVDLTVYAAELVTLFDRAT